MKYTVEGFSQSEACKFKDKIEIKKGNKVKLVEIKIDCTDLVILRWIVDFYPSMIKLNFDNKEYVWINYNTLLKEMPLLDIKKQALADRLQKLCHFKILERKTIKQGGTFSYYSFGENYDKLIRSTTEGECSQLQRVCSQLHEGTQSTTEGECSQLQNKDSSISNSSIKYSFKESKRERDTFDEIIERYTEDEYIRGLLIDWLKVRKVKRAANTNRAIELNINKLDRIAQESKLSVKEYLEEVIARGWTAFYKINDFNKSNGVSERNNANKDYSGDWD